MKGLLNGKWILIFLTTFILLGVLVVIPQVFIEKDGPSSKPGIPKDNLDNEFTNPNKIPYVAPQNNNATADEKDGKSGQWFTITPGKNDEKDPYPGGSLQTLAGIEKGKDIFASRLSSSHDFHIRNLSLTSYSNGRIYTAYESVSTGGDQYIEINYSEDGGLTWKSSGWAWQTGKDLTQPSVAVTDEEIVVAYVVDDHTNPTYVEVANASLTVSGTAFTSHSIIHPFSNPEYDPYIWTDSNIYTSTSVYLVFEEEFASNNVNIIFERSADNGDTWKDQVWLWGTGDSDEFIDPHGCFGENNYHMLYVVGYNKTEKTIYLRKCNNWGGGTWDTAQALYTLSYEPGSSSLVAPTVAASTTAGTDHVLVGFANSDAAGDDDVGYLRSLDNGASWGGPWYPPGLTTSDEVMPIIYAGPSGDKFHLVYTNGPGHDVYHTDRSQAFSDLFRNPWQVNRGGLASWDYPEKGITSHWTFDFPSVVWLDYSYHPSGYYSPYFNRLYPDDLVGTWSGQGVYFRTETNSWKNMTVPAEQVAVGDLDGDGTADLLGVWAAQGGVWVERSSTKSWSFLGSTPRDIYTGDMDGDGVGELLGTWDGQGVYYLTAVGGSWVNIATPASLIAAGDIDGDGTADLLGVWTGQGGVWVKYSSSGLWEKLGTTPRHISSGDMDGDGRADLLGTWDGQGVYYLDSISKVWVNMATPANLIAAGDMDGDGTDDLIGTWPGQGGIWVKYSDSATWSYLSSTADDISAGLMRAGTGTWATAGKFLFEPLGGEAKAPLQTNFTDLSSTGPGGNRFEPSVEQNLLPQEVEGGSIIKIAGPGEPGFRCVEQPNLFPVKNQEERHHGRRKEPVKK